MIYEAAVKGHLEICQRIMWSLGISHFTEFHPRDDNGLTSLHQATAQDCSRPARNMLLDYLLSNPHQCYRH